MSAEEILNLFERGEMGACESFDELEKLVKADVPGAAGVLKAILEGTVRPSRLTTEYVLELFRRKKMYVNTAIEILEELTKCGDPEAPGVLLVIERGALYQTSKNGKNGNDKEMRHPRSPKQKEKRTPVRTVSVRDTIAAAA